MDVYDFNLLLQVLYFLFSFSGGDTKLDMNKNCFNFFFLFSERDDYLIIGKTWNILMFCLKP